MRRITLLSCCSLALLSVFISPPVVRGQQQSAPPPETRYLFCVGVASPQSTMYYSGIIATTEKNLSPVHVAFFQFLKQKYAYKGPGDYPGDLQCTGNRTLEEARSYLQIYVNRDRQNKRTVVETGWTYIAAPAPPAPPVQDPRMAQIPEPLRRQMLNEMSNSNAFCQNHVLISGLVDCVCFSKAVLSYRIAHAKEYHATQGVQDTRNYEPISNILALVDCTECISDEKILKWAADQTLKTLAPNYPEPGKKFMTDCVPRNFLANFRAKPYVGEERDHWIRALESCTKQLNH